LGEIAATKTSHSVVSKVS